MGWLASAFPDPTTLLLYAIGVCVLVILIRGKGLKNLPPGPVCLPGVGYSPFLGENGAETFRLMKKKYGPVMTVKMGFENWIVLNDFDAINEALVRHGDVFSGRPDLFKIVTGGYGVGSSDYGLTWKTLRKFGLTTLRDFSDDADGKIFILIMMAPSLRHLPVFKRVHNNVLKERNKVFDIFRGLIKEHEDTFIESDIRDFTDAFLKEMKAQRKGDECFSEKQLLMYIRDLIEAGTGTTSGTLLWTILCLAHYPVIQEKLAKEVEAVIGESGVPTMTHRNKMPYTCAFIQEIQRHRVVLPLSVQHKTTEACVFRGYDIPKGITVVPNLWSVHFDPDLFENPTEFRPERFIDSDGKFVKSNHVIPFSVGPRFCLCEQLARMELFLFLTTIVQKLRIVPDPSKPLADFSKAAFNMLTYECPAFDVKFEKR